MKDVAIVPVKGPSEAKKRLSSHLSQEEREKFARAMLTDVLKAIHRSRKFSEVTVISPDESIKEHAEQTDSVFLRQTGTGLNSAVLQATRTATQKKIASATVILADLPLLDSADLEELFRISEETPRVVLVPSLKGGTNIMMRSPPNVIGSSYGRWSYTKHLRAAQEGGVPVYSFSNPRISRDIDTISDLRVLRLSDPSGNSGAGRLAKEVGRLHPVLRHS